METKEIKKSPEEIFNEYSEKLKEALDAFPNEELAEKRVGYVLCKMTGEDTDVVFTGGVEHAARAIYGILKIFTKPEATAIMQCVIEVMLSSLLREKMENIMTSPVSPNKSTLEN